MGDSVRSFGGELPRGEGPLVLVVSDSPVLRDLLAVILKQRGFRVVPAADRAAARAVVEADPVSAAVVDVRPVSAEGRGFASWLRVSGVKVRTVLVVEKGGAGDLAVDLKAAVLTVRDLERGPVEDLTRLFRAEDRREGCAS